MSTRLQVRLDDEEFREIRRPAKARKTTVAEWVREALRVARARQPQRSQEDKLKAIRAAAKHSFPTGDIDQMLAEIERGDGLGDGP
ncbi:MAG: antitoxin [Myxococcota bacterium]